MNYPETQNSNPFLFGVRNGVVDLKSGALRQGKPEDRISKVAPVAFEPAAMCPLWEEFLNRIMAGNPAMITFLQRLAGYCLTGDIREQILPIVWGDGQNGKNTFLEALSGLMGPYACDAPPGLLTIKKNEEHPTEIADLCGRRLVIASETEQGARLRMQLVKKLTGDRLLKGRFMRQDYFEFERTHKTVMMTNTRPEVSENTFAVWRRLRLVPLAVVIPPEERDAQLGEKLRTEWPGILAWAVRGCLDWLRNGLGEPAEVVNATKAYQREQDTLSEFWESCFVLSPDAFIARGELHGTYMQWAERNNERHPLDRIRPSSALAGRDRGAEENWQRTLAWFSRNRTPAK